MKSIKLILTCVTLLIYGITYGQSTTTGTKNVSFKIEGITNFDTISISTIENMKELKIVEVYSNTKIIAEFEILKYAAAIVPKGSEAEFFSITSNKISEQFLANLKKMNGVIRVILGEIEIQNNINGDILKGNPFVFFVKI